MPQIYVSTRQVAEALNDLEIQEFISTVVSVLDNFQMLEVDEELIAAIWSKSRNCYEDGEKKPTLDDLVKQYKKD